MRVSPLVPTLAFLLASAAAQAGGGVYQWKDANGVTHFTDTPPPASNYQHRNIYHDTAVAAPPAKPSENPACATARGNIALLQGKQALQVDSDGDGKPDKTLDDTGRANQLALAEATLKASCGASASAVQVAGSAGN